MDEAWEKEFGERKVQVREKLVRDGKIDWEHLGYLEGLRNRNQFTAAIGVLIDMNILSLNQKGFFAIANGIFCNPRAPVLWGMELYFTKRQDCQNYVDSHFRNAQYSVNIAEMT
jgi:hypothetical protein